MNRSKTQHSRPNTVRIIAGQWRGRKLQVANISGLRPTGDRIRETLFNWLEPEIGGARCLDLFTGSGALALEALSRGAAVVIAVDSHKDAVGSLRELQKLLSAEGLQLIHSDAQSWLAAHREEQFDIVFLDPPFQTCTCSGLWVSSASFGTALFRYLLVAPYLVLFDLEKKCIYLMSQLLCELHELLSCQTVTNTSM